MIDFAKYRKIYIIGHDENKDIFTNPSDEIVIEEKIDGGNFRFYISKKGDVIIGSRTQQLTDNKGKDTNMNKMFKSCSDFIRQQLKGKSLKQYGHLIFYGENCVKHTINYDWNKMPIYLGYDIYNTDTKQYVHHNVAVELFKTLGLEFVPIIKTLKAKDIPKIDDELVPISKYALESAQDRKAEGVVFKNYNKQIFAKYVRDRFKEKNAEVFGGSPRYNKIGDTDNAEFVFKYCTNARIEKLIMVQIDEGKPLDMTIMGDLIRNTYEDIISEEWHEILTSNWKLDFKGIRKALAPRCRAVLEQMIINNVR